MQQAHSALCSKHKKELTDHHAHRVITIQEYGSLENSRQDPVTQETKLVAVTKRWMTHSLHERWTV